MSIAQQVATPNPSRPARARSRPAQLAPARRRVRALVRICGLLALTALAVTLTIGTVAVGLVLLVSNVAS
jgi:uncharacterized membrane protein HdeD (DUF308 family)